MKKNVGKKILGRKYVRLTNHTTTTYVKTVKDEYWGTEHKIKTTLDSSLYPLITTYGKTRASQMTVKTFLSDLLEKAKPVAEIEMQRLKAFAVAEGNGWEPAVVPTSEVTIVGACTVVTNSTQV